MTGDGSFFPDPPGSQSSHLNVKSVISYHPVLEFNGNRSECWLLFDDGDVLEKHKSRPLKKPVQPSEAAASTSKPGFANTFIETTLKGGFMRPKEDDDVSQKSDKVVGSKKPMDKREVSGDRKELRKETFRDRKRSNSRERRRSRSRERDRRRSRSPARRRSPVRDRRYADRSAISRRRSRSRDRKRSRSRGRDRSRSRGRDRSRSRDRLRRQVHDRRTSPDRGNRSMSISSNSSDENSKSKKDDSEILKQFAEKLQEKSKTSGGNKSLSSIRLSSRLEDTKLRRGETVAPIMFSLKKVPVKTLPGSTIVQKAEETLKEKAPEPIKAEVSTPSSSVNTPSSSVNIPSRISFSVPPPLIPGPPPVSQPQPFRVTDGVTVACAPTLYKGGKQIPVSSNVISLPPPTQASPAAAPAANQPPPAVSQSTPLMSIPPPNSQPMEAPKISEMHQNLAAQALEYAAFAKAQEGMGMEYHGMMRVPPGPPPGLPRPGQGIRPGMMGHGFMGPGPGMMGPNHYGPRPLGPEGPFMGPPPHGPVGQFMGPPPCGPGGPFMGLPHHGPEGPFLGPPPGPDGSFMGPPPGPDGSFMGPPGPDMPFMGPPSHVPEGPFFGPPSHGQGGSLMGPPPGGPGMQNPPPFFGPQGGGMLLPQINTDVNSSSAVPENEPINTPASDLKTSPKDKDTLPPKPRHFGLEIPNYQKLKPIVGVIKGLQYGKRNLHKLNSETSEYCLKRGLVCRVNQDLEKSTLVIVSPDDRNSRRRIVTALVLEYPDMDVDALIELFENSFHDMPMEDIEDVFEYESNKRKAKSEPTHSTFFENKSKSSSHSKNKLADTSKPEVPTKVPPVAETEKATSPTVDKAKHMSTIEELEITKAKDGPSKTDPQSLEIPNFKKLEFVVGLIKFLQTRSHLNEQITSLGKCHSDEYCIKEGLLCKVKEESEKQVVVVVVPDDENVRKTIVTAFVLKYPNLDVDGLIELFEKAFDNMPVEDIEDVFENESTRRSSLLESVESDFSKVKSISSCGNVVLHGQGGRGSDDDAAKSETASTQPKETLVMEVTDASKGSCELPTTNESEALAEPITEVKETSDISLASAECDAVQSSEKSRHDSGRIESHIFANTTSTPTNIIAEDKEMIDENKLGIETSAVGKEDQHLYQNDPTVVEEQKSTSVETVGEDPPTSASESGAAIACVAATIIPDSPMVETESAPDLPKVESDAPMDTLKSEGQSTQPTSSLQESSVLVSDSEIHAKDVPESELNNTKSDVETPIITSGGVVMEKSCNSIIKSGAESSLEVAPAGNFEEQVAQITVPVEGDESVKQTIGQEVVDAENSGGINPDIKKIDSDTVNNESSGSVKENTELAAGDVSMALECEDIGHAETTPTVVETLQSIDGGEQFDDDATTISKLKEISSVSAGTGTVLQEDMKTSSEHGGTIESFASMEAGHEVDANAARKIDSTQTEMIVVKGDTEQDKVDSEQMKLEVQGVMSEKTLSENVSSNHINYESKLAEAETSQKLSAHSKKVVEEDELGSEDPKPASLESEDGTGKSQEPPLINESEKTLCTPEDPHQSQGEVATVVESDLTTISSNVTQDAETTLEQKPQEHEIDDSNYVGAQQGFQIIPTAALSPKTSVCKMQIEGEPPENESYDAPSEKERASDQTPAELETPRDPSKHDYPRSQQQTSDASSSIAEGLYQTPTVSKRIADEKLGEASSVSDSETPSVSADPASTPSSEDRLPKVSELPNFEDTVPCTETESTPSESTTDIAGAEPGKPELGKSNITSDSKTPGLSADPISTPSCEDRPLKVSELLKFEDAVPSTETLTDPPESTTDVAGAKPDHAETLKEDNETGIEVLNSVSKQESDVTEGSGKSADSEAMHTLTDVPGEVKAESVQIPPSEREEANITPDSKTAGLSANPVSTSSSEDRLPNVSELPKVGEGVPCIGTLDLKPEDHAVVTEELASEAKPDIKMEVETDEVTVVKEELNTTGVKEEVITAEVDNSESMSTVEIPRKVEAPPQAKPIKFKSTYELMKSMDFGELKEVYTEPDTLTIVNYDKLSFFASRLIEIQKGSDIASITSQIMFVRYDASDQFAMKSGLLCKRKNLEKNEVFIVLLKSTTVYREIVSALTEQYPDLEFNEFMSLIDSSFSYITPPEITSLTETIVGKVTYIKYQSFIERCQLVNYDIICNMEEQLKAMQKADSAIMRRYNRLKSNNCVDDSYILKHDLVCLFSGTIDFKVCLPKSQPDQISIMYIVHESNHNKNLIEFVELLRATFDGVNISLIDKAVALCSTCRPPATARASSIIKACEQKCPALKSLPPEVIFKIRQVQMASSVYKAQIELLTKGQSRQGGRYILDTSLLCRAMTKGEEQVYRVVVSPSSLKDVVSLLHTTYHRKTLSEFVPFINEFLAVTEEVCKAAIQECNICANKASKKLGDTQKSPPPKISHNEVSKRKSPDPSRKETKISSKDKPKTSSRKETETAKAEISKRDSKEAPKPTKDSSKRESRESSKYAHRKESSKEPAKSPRREPFKETTKDVSKRESSKELNKYGSKREYSKEPTKDGSKRESSKDGSTRESSKDGSKRESSKDGSKRDSSKESKTPEPETLKTKEYETKKQSEPPKTARGQRIRIAVSRDSQIIQRIWGRELAEKIKYILRLVPDKVLADIIDRQKSCPDLMEIRKDVERSKPTKDAKELLCGDILFILKAKNKLKIAAKPIKNINYILITQIHAEVHDWTINKISATIGIVFDVSPSTEEVEATINWFCTKCQKPESSKPNKIYSSLDERLHDFYLTIHNTVKSDKAPTRCEEPDDEISKQIDKDLEVLGNVWGTDLVNKIKAAIQPIPYNLRKEIIDRQRECVELVDIIEPLESKTPAKEARHVLCGGILFVVKSKKKAMMVKIHVKPIGHKKISYVLITQMHAAYHDWTVNRIFTAIGVSFDVCPSIEEVAVTIEWFCSDCQKPDMASKKWANLDDQLKCFYSSVDPLLLVEKSKEDCDDDEDQDVDLTQEIPATDVRVALAKLPSPVVSKIQIAQMGSNVLKTQIVLLENKEGPARGKGYCLVMSLLCKLVKLDDKFAWRVMIPTDMLKDLLIELHTVHYHDMIQEDFFEFVSSFMTVSENLVNEIFATCALCLTTVRRVPTLCERGINEDLVRKTLAMIAEMIDFVIKWQTETPAIAKIREGVKKGRQEAVADYILYKDILFKVSGKTKGGKPPRPKIAVSQLPNALDEVVKSSHAFYHSNNQNQLMNLINVCFDVTVPRNLLSTKIPELCKICGKKSDAQKVDGDKNAVDISCETGSVADRSSSKKCSSVGDGQAASHSIADGSSTSSVVETRAGASTSVKLEPGSEEPTPLGVLLLGRLCDQVIEESSNSSRALDSPVPDVSISDTKPVVRQIAKIIIKRCAYDPSIVQTLTEGTTRKRKTETKKPPTKRGRKTKLTKIKEEPVSAEESADNASDSESSQPKRKFVVYSSESEADSSSSKTQKRKATTSSAPKAKKPRK